MGAARKYPDELRDRAVRLVLDLVKDQDASVTAACRKVGGELGLNADTLRGWAKQAQIDRGLLDSISNDLSAVIGLWNESVVRGPAWHFGEIGRRLERVFGVIDGVRRFRWTPAILNNKPVATDLTLTVQVQR